MRIKTDGYDLDNYDLSIIVNDIKTCQDCIDKIEKPDIRGKIYDVVHLTDMRICKHHKQLIRYFMRYNK